MEPALFPLRDMFGGEEDDDDDTPGSKGPSGEPGGVNPGHEEEDEYVVRQHPFPGGKELRVREFSFHQCNANLLWPGCLAFAGWLWERPELLAGSRVLELGSGTGALAVFLHKEMGCDVTTSDYDDPVIEENIAVNCGLNGIEPLPHIRHTWGDPFPVTDPTWDTIVASDILLYVKQYPNLIKTLQALLSSGGHSVVDEQGRQLCKKKRFIMSWRRRIPKEDEQAFFQGCELSNMSWKDMGSRVFEITC